MAAQRKEAPVVGEPGPDTFDFVGYVQGQSKFHTFEHTLYLNQEAGIEMARIVDEYDELAKQGRILQGRKRRMDEQVRSFVDDEYDTVVSELEAIVEKTDALEGQLKELEERVRSSALTIHFMGGTAQKYGEVLRKAERSFEKQHGRKSNDDTEWLAAKGRWITSAQLTAYATGITPNDGVRRPAPDAAGFGVLLNSLITTEQVRLMEALQSGLDAAIKFHEKVDAGFPGRGTDLAGVGVADTGAEGGAEVGGSPADDADGA